MKTISVTDIALESDLQGSYDLAVFASGYEARCTHIPRLIRGIKASQVLVLGFEGVSDNDARRMNDAYFDQSWTADRLEMRDCEDEALYAYLNALSLKAGTSLRVFVDYSSMSRLWYAAIINWARLVENVDVQLDFGYAPGVYESNLQPIVISEILSIPGFEGGALRRGMCVAIFGLGFYGLMTECVLELLEPDIVYGFLASPASDPTYPSRVRANNKELIAIAEHILEAPLASVSTATRYLKEIVVPYLTQGDIVLVPMGPKPHVLAAMLVASEFHEVACLRVGAKREKVENVSAHGDVILTRVGFISVDSLTSVDKQSHDGERFNNAVLH